MPVSENTSNPFNNNSDEAQEDTNLDMLYEDFKTYAVGHGVAASWDNNLLNPPLNVSTSSFAEHDVPNVTPDIHDAMGNLIKIPINILSEENRFNEEGLQKLESFLEEYQKWIEDKIMVSIS